MSHSRGAITVVCSYDGKNFRTQFNSFTQHEGFGDPYVLPLISLGE